MPTTKLKKLLLAFDGFIACIFLILLTGILFYEVVTRYCFGISSAFNSEAAGLLFIWFVYLSISYITGQRNHIVVDVAVMIFPKSWLKYIDLFSDAIFLAFSLILCWNGVRLVASTVEYPLAMPISGLPMSVAYAIVPLAFGIMSIRLVGILLSDIQHIRHERANAQGAPHA